MRRGPGSRLSGDSASCESLRCFAALPPLLELAGSLAIIDAVVDYVFKAEASRALGHGHQLLGFFALFYTGTAALTFVAQMVLSAPVLKRFGLGGAVATLPGATALLSVLAMAVPGLGSAGLLRGVAAVAESSLYRAGYELFYTPVPVAGKRSAKALIDVGSVRLGTIVGSGTIVGVLGTGVADPHVVLLVGSAVGSALVLTLTLRLSRGYVAALASSLRSGALRLDRHRLIDSTTLHALDESLALSRRNQPPKLQRASERREQPLQAREVEQDVLVGRVEGLTSGDPIRASKVLEQALPAELISLSLPWLAHDELAPLVARALGDHVPNCAGTMIDALLDHARPAAVRRRLPPILANADSERIQRGLSAALGDPQRSVRARAAAALRRIRERAGALVLTEREVLEAVRRELALGPSSPAEAEQDARPGRDDLQLVFALLALCFEAEAIRACSRAVMDGDTRLRGTALEYLDNILPADLRESLFHRLRAVRSSQQPARSRALIVRELVSGTDHARRSAPD